MYSSPVRFIPQLYGLILFLSCSALFINFFIYQFPGNNYFPPNVLLIALNIIIICLGFWLIFGKDNRLTKSGIEIFYFFAIMSLIAFTTNAIQLTPYSPIDNKIIELESYLHINLVSILEWTAKHPSFKRILEYIYDSLPYQMSYIPLFIIISGRFKIIREYYFLILVTTLIGFAFYYFFPTTAPASNIKSPLFSSEQIATGYKFNQIHHYINPTTNEGGLIALPSFHTVWAFLCVYLLKEWFIPCIVLLIINIFLVLSCVLLGWHYSTDVMGAFLLLGLSFYFLNRCKSSSTNTP